MFLGDGIKIIFGNKKNMIRKKPILNYEPSIEYYSNQISPAKNHIPNWYKKIPQWVNGKPFSLQNGYQPTVKICTPFLDSFTTGYMISLAHDIYVINENGIPYITWKDSSQKHMPSARASVADKNLIPTGHFSTEFLWKLPIAFKVPAGYSFLYTHPLNRYDLPFTTLTGVVDGNFVLQAGANTPFYLKEDFEGIIEQGTPIVQIIPFLQQSWHSKLTKGVVKEGEKNNTIGNSLLSGSYKKRFWTRKKYN